MALVEYDPELDTTDEDFPCCQETMEEVHDGTTLPVQLQSERTE